MKIETCQSKRNKWMMRWTDTKLYLSSLCMHLFHFAVLLYHMWNMHGIHPFEMLPLRLMIELLMQERQSPATTQVVNSYTEGKDRISFIRWDTGQEMSILTSCTDSIFSDFYPCPVDQLSVVARMLTGIIKGTLLRNPGSWLSLSAMPF